MAFNFNGNTPKKILYNGLNVAKLVYNGVVVWMSKVLATVSGILPLTLTNSTGDDLVDYKIYGNSEEIVSPLENFGNDPTSKVKKQACKLENNEANNEINNLHSEENK